MISQFIFKKQDHFFFRNLSRFSRIRICLKFQLALFDDGKNLIFFLAVLGASLLKDIWIVQEPVKSNKCCCLPFYLHGLSQNSEKI